MGIMPKMQISAYSYAPLYASLGVLSNSNIWLVQGSIIIVEMIAITKINPHTVLINFDICFCLPPPIIIAMITWEADEKPPMNAFKNIATEPPIETADVPVSPSL